MEVGDRGEGVRQIDIGIFALRSLERNSSLQAHACEQCH